MPELQTPTPAPTPVELIAFERKHPGFGPQKIDVIRDQLGITEVRYCVLLDRAIDDPAAAEADPITVRRLREKRDRDHSGRGRILRHNS